MAETSFWLDSSDGMQIYIKHWFNENEHPKAIVQLSHGMAEHIERYAPFARFLLSKGIFVYGNDHRGHGHTGNNTHSMGFFAEENGFDRVVEDLYQINQAIHESYPDVPVIMLGHSMGSFLARRYIQLYGHSIVGLVISGTGGNPGFMGKIGKLVAKLEITKNGKRAPSHLMDKLSFGSFNKKFKNIQTDFDWLSSDREQVKKYIDDPFCGQVSSAGFFYDLLTGLEIIHQEEYVRDIPKSLPLFFISGTLDPVGKNTKGVMQVIDQYKKHGMEKVEWQYYQDGRHEILNEVNRKEVYEDVYKWIVEKCLS